MALLFPNGADFTTGAINYIDRPITQSETTNRIILRPNQCKLIILLG